MPSKRQPSAPQWQVILEEVRSQNRSTIEAVEASHAAVEGRFDRLEEETRSRFEVVKAAIQATNKTVESTREALDQRIERSDQDNRARFAALEATIQRLDQESRSRDASLEIAVSDLKVSVQQNSVDIRDLAGKVEALARLEERVAALERGRG